MKTSNQPQRANTRVRSAKKQAVLPAKPAATVHAPLGTPKLSTSGRHELVAPRARMPWTDFQLVLAISRAGSVARACGELGMTHSTLLRKLDTIESQLKTRLFERSRQTYELTTAGTAIAQAAQDFEPAARNAETMARGLDLRPSGDVRVSVSSVLIAQLLPPILAQFASAFPDVQIELSASRDHASLRRREADVAIRIADSVPDWLVGRKLADVQFKVYGSSRGRSGTPLRTVSELRLEPGWISFEQDGSELKFDRWLATTLPAQNICLRVDDFSHALTMARAGLGMALLPSFVEAQAPDLRPLTASIAELQTPLWLITHPELRNTARVRVLMQAFAPALANAMRALA